MRLSIIGSRGIPGRYGGFETFAEKLSLGLIEKGCDVTIYCIASYCDSREKYYKKVKRVFIPAPKKKSLEKIIYTLLSFIHASFRRNDILLLLGVPGVIFSIIPKFFKKIIVVNIDGLEWKREKWNTFARWFLKISERLSGVFCDAIVTDSMAIQRYYFNRYRRKAHYIAYGADIIESVSSDILEQYGIGKRQYYLQVCRLEPENNSHIVIREFEKTKTKKSLVILGDAPYSDNYIKFIKKTNDPRIIFLGAIYGRRYKKIISNAYAYIHAHQVGGTNPALLEAMAAKNCVLVLNTPFNLEVIGESGYSFNNSDGNLARLIEFIDNNPDLANKFRKKAVKRINDCYTWAQVIREYEGLFRDLKNGKS